MQDGADAGQASVLLPQQLEDGLGRASATGRYLDVVQEMRVVHGRPSFPWSASARDVDGLLADSRGRIV